MILVCDKGKAYFNRLRYQGVPKYETSGKFDPKKYSFVDRDIFIRKLYELMLLSFNSTALSRFTSICRYLRWLDSNELEPINQDYFHLSLIQLYMEQWDSWVANNKDSHGSWVVARKAIAWYFSETGRKEDKKKLPILNDQYSNTKPFKALDIESELKPISKALFRGFNRLSENLAKGTIPSIHPLFDNELFEAQSIVKSWSKREKSNKKNQFITTLNLSDKTSGNWRNALTRCAVMICFMFTGMNTGPMLRMQRKDVIFKQIGSGRYVLNSVKGRSGYQDQDNTIGFSKHAKRFIEKWLELSLIITGDDDDAWLFPIIETDNSISYFHQQKRPPQEPVNKLLQLLGLPKINSSRFRKTKIDVLMRVTQDIYLTSISANNTPKVISKNYSYGVESDHERNLSAAMDAQFNFAKGEVINKSVINAKVKFKDPLSDYDYKRLRKDENTNNESRTPLGVRCKDNTKGASEIIDKAMKRLNVNVDEGDPVCTDFLMCFECEFHALVADVDDIWLMLSFFDTLEDMKVYPSINSVPETRFNNLYEAIKIILFRFKSISPKNYKAAQEKHKIGSHPFYSCANSLNDLMEIFS